VCATDPNTDIGRIAERNGYGFWCESFRPEDFTALVDKMLAADRKSMGEKGYEFLRNNYTVEHTYKAIMKHFC
jgi:spore maturation protein CgeB